VWLLHLVIAVAIDAAVEAASAAAATAAVVDDDAEIVNNSSVILHESSVYCRSIRRSRCSMACGRLH